MKKQLFFFLTLAAAAACQKNPQDAIKNESLSGEDLMPVCFQIGPQQADTKALYNTTNVKDFQINSLQVFVYNDGVLETDYYTTFSALQNTASVTMNTSSGSKVIYAVANHPQIACKPGVSAIEGLEGTICDLNVNTLSNFVMTGKAQVTVNPYDRNKNPDQQAQVIQVYVKRIVSMIRLDGITVDFSGTSLAGASFTIKEMYLKNAMGKAHLGLSGYTTSNASDDVKTLTLDDSYYEDEQYWYNPRVKDSNVANYPAALLVDGAEISVTTGSPFTVNHALFTCPNNTDPDDDIHLYDWSPRCTRLVLYAVVDKPSAGIDEVDSYYILDLPQLISNKIYSIQNIRITQLGADEDLSDVSPQSGRITPTISVNPWNSQVETLNYEF